MSDMLARKTFTAMLSIVTIGAAFTLGAAQAVAGDDPTEDQIVRALAPKKPLTRGLHVVGTLLTLSLIPIAIVTHQPWMWALLPICGAARCSPHNHVFLEGVRAALLADPAFLGGAYVAPPVAGLRAFGTAYAGWAYSRQFFLDAGARSGRGFRALGYTSVDHVLADWAEDHARRGGGKADQRERQHAETRQPR